MPKRIDQEPPLQTAKPKPRKPNVSQSNRRASIAASAKSHSIAHDASRLAERVIKKYPNRRLYDTQTSAYITLSEVRDLVMRNAPLVVIDAKTQKDLTRSIFLQIILEEESGGAPMFTPAVLANIIRFYGNTMQGFMGDYLEKNVQSLMDLQATMGEKSQGLSPEMWAQFANAQSPMMQSMMGAYIEQSKSVFTQMQEQMQRQSEKMLSTFGMKL